MAVLLVVAGLALLVAGAEALVRGASRLAAVLGVSPLVIGLTVVAFGTSAPELAVSVKSAWNGQAALALGNVVGSNIFNVLFILGVSALITPLVVHSQLVRIDVPIMVGLSVVTALLCLDGDFGRVDGAVFVCGLVAYTALQVRQGRKEGASGGGTGEFAKEFGAAAPPTRAAWAMNAALVLGGLALLVWGSRWLVDGATTIATRLGVSELIIGLTIVAAGTSLPEVVTSIVASVRGERDIAVGNVVGSNIFNLAGVLGLSGLVAPAGIEVLPAALEFDVPVMVAVAFACLPVFYTGRMIARWEGALFLAYYVAYTAFLVLESKQSATLPALRTAMIGFVLPLTAVTLAVVTARAYRAGKRSVKAHPDA